MVNGFSLHFQERDDSLQFAHVQAPVTTGVSMAEPQSVHEPS